jgi:hypothetical protein
MSSSAGKPRPRPRPTPPARSARLPSHRPRPSAGVTAFATWAPAPGSCAPLSGLAGLVVVGLRVAEPTGALVSTPSYGQFRVQAIAAAEATIRGRGTDRARHLDCFLAPGRSRTPAGYAPATMKWVDRISRAVIAVLAVALVGFGAAQCAEKNWDIGPPMIGFGFMCLLIAWFGWGTIWEFLGP